MIPPASESLLRLVQDFGVLIQPLIDMTPQLTEPLLDERRAVVEDLAQLRVRWIDWLLQ
jgi:hypothetical protein